MYPTMPLKEEYYTPILPPTPAPKTLDAMRNDVGERFAGMVLIRKNIKSSLDDYFIEYDNWEKYSEFKCYTSETYQAAYKGTMKEYQNYLCILNGSEGDEFYVAAKRIPGELETLEPHCPCFTCSCSVINPLKYLWCPHCTGCIKAGPGCASKNNIEKARQSKIEKEAAVKKPSKYTPYIPNLPATRTMEIGIGILALSVLYFVF